METSAPVTIIAKVKKDMATGARLEVECLETISQSGTAVKGKWGFYLLIDQPDGETFRSQVVVWQKMEPKVLKTLNGLMSLAAELNISAPIIPRIEGRKGIWRVDEYLEDGSES